MPVDSYSTIREILGDLVGKSVIDITQHDEEYFIRTGRTFVDLMFDDGAVLRIYGLTDDPFVVLNPTDEVEAKMFSGDEESA